MLTGLVTVVPSSETERPWWFFFFFSSPSSCARSCVEWAVSDTHHAARPSPASSQRANPSPGLGGCEKQRAVSRRISPGHRVLGSSREPARLSTLGVVLVARVLASCSLHHSPGRAGGSKAKLSSSGNPELFPLFSFAPVPPAFGELPAFE